MRSYYRAIPNGPLMVTLKRTPKSGGAEMNLNFMLTTDAIPLIKRLSQFWISTHQNPETLKDALSDIYESIETPNRPRTMHV